MGEGNGFVPLVPLEELPADLRAQWEVTPRAGLQDFLRLMANAPDFFRGFSDLNGKIRANNHLGPRTTELVRLAVAQTTRCKVCLAGRSPAAIEAGMTEELIAEIGADTPRQMTPAEHAAVMFASKFATDHLAITDADKAALREHFDAEQVVELALFTVLCMVGRFTMLVGLEEESCPI
jgi:AhpD family alkylhydroperoxidase